MVTDRQVRRLREQRMTGNIVVIKHFDQGISRTRIAHLAKRDHQHLTRSTMAAVSGESNDLVEHRIVRNFGQCVSDGPFQA